MCEIKSENSEINYFNYKIVIIIIITEWKITIRFCIKTEENTKREKIQQ